MQYALGISAVLFFEFFCRMVKDIVLMSIPPDSISWKPRDIPTLLFTASWLTVYEFCVIMSMESSHRTADKLQALAITVGIIGHFC
jgi:hypothetical protein